jgi:hypothetical protein
MARISCRAVKAWCSGAVKALGNRGCRWLWLRLAVVFWLQQRHELALAAVEICVDDGPRQLNWGCESNQVASQGELASARADKVAVVQEDGCRTYQELNSAAM